MSREVVPHHWQEKALCLESASIHYWEAGAGEPLVFLHGGPGDSHTYLRPLAANFLGEYRCILFDQRGSGKSRLTSYDVKALTISEIVSDIDRLLEELGVKSAAFVGHSWGAMLGLRYAADRPDRVAKLILIGLGPLSGEGEAVYSANFEQHFTASELEEIVKLRSQRKLAARDGDHRGAMVAHSELVRRFYAQAWIYNRDARQQYINRFVDDEGFDKRAGDLIWESTKGYDWLASLARVKTPVLVQYGAQDIEPITQAIDLREGLPRCMIVILNRCGHMPWLDQPEQSVAAIANFLKPAPNTTVVLEPFAVEWQTRFQKEAKCLRDVLGASLLDLQHVGSTAVPGLSAKPIVDMLGVVSDLRDLDACRDSLAAAGYAWKGEAGVARRRFFTKDNQITQSRQIHLHIFAANDSEVATHLLFRDYLRTHPDAVEKYAALKQELGRKYEFDRPRYTEAKAPFIQSILNKARNDAAMPKIRPTSNTLEHARNLLAIAQTGLAYTKNIFDRERFMSIQRLATEMLATVANGDIEQVEHLILPEKGYATPKIDVRAAVFQQDKILLVQERSDGLWTMPGGWADVGSGPAECIEREVLEEAGLTVKATKLIACLDKRQHDHPPELFHTWKLFFLCELLSGYPASGVETSQVGYFAANEIPPLSTHRVTATQIQRAFAHRHDRTLFPDFD